MSYGFSRCRISNITPRSASVEQSATFSWKGERVVKHVKPLRPNSYPISYYIKLDLVALIAVDHLHGSRSTIRDYVLLVAGRRHELFNCLIKPQKAIWMKETGTQNKARKLQTTQNHHYSLSLNLAIVQSALFLSVLSNWWLCRKC